MQVKKAVNQFSTQDQPAFMTLVNLAVPPPPFFFLVKKDFTEYSEDLENFTCPREPRT